jgi:hypothetical protein
LLGAPTSVLAQRGTLKAVTASASVADLGVVGVVSPLAWYTRLPTGDIKVAGTVTSTHNGAYVLQSRLSKSVPDTVLARAPNGSYVLLTTTAWVAVAQGTGGTKKSNAVDYWIKWGKGSSKKPQDAEAIPVIYRVIAPLHQGRPR